MIALPETIKAALIAKGREYDAWHNHAVKMYPDRQRYNMEALDYDREHGRQVRAMERLLEVQCAAAR